MGRKGCMGEPLAHDSAELHVTGAAAYTDDLPEPAGCLYAYILKSPHAHARIRKIDISPCCMPGVHAVTPVERMAKDVIPAVAGF